jgi:hypothetical protein
MVNSARQLPVPMLYLCLPAMPAISTECKEMSEARGRHECWSEFDLGDITARGDASAGGAAER